MSPALDLQFRLCVHCTRANGPRCILWMHNASHHTSFLAISLLTEISTWHWHNCVFQFRGACAVWLSALRGCSSLLTRSCGLNCACNVIGPCCRWELRQRPFLPPMHQDVQRCENYGHEGQGKGDPRQSHMKEIVCVI